jgi:hypothetical protein
VDEFAVVAAAGVKVEDTVDASAFHRPVDEATVVVVVVVVAVDSALGQE